MTQLETSLKKDAEYERRRAHWTAELERLAAEEAGLALGGGEKAQARQREQGKWTARERIAALCDPGAPFDEIGLYRDAHRRELPTQKIAEMREGR